MKDDHTTNFHCPTYIHFVWELSCGKFWNHPEKGSLPRLGSISKFPCSLTRNITSHGMENLAFHSLLRWKMIILPIDSTSCIHTFFLWKVRRMWFFELRSERVNLEACWLAVYLVGCPTCSQGLHFGPTPAGPAFAGAKFSLQSHQKHCITQ